MELWFGLLLHRISHGQVGRSHPAGGTIRGEARFSIPLPRTALLSGGFVSQNTRITKVGNLYLRYYFILGTSLLRQHNLEYKAYYWRKYQEVSKYQHKRALVLTARKLVRLVHALFTKNEPYMGPRTTVDGQEDDERHQHSNASYDIFIDPLHQQEKT